MFFTYNVHVQVEFQGKVTDADFTHVGLPRLQTIVIVSKSSVWNKTVYSKFVYKVDGPKGCRKGCIRIIGVFSTGDRVEITVHQR